MLPDTLNGLFKDRDYYKILFKIAAPIVIQNLITSSVNIVDTLMVGRLGEAEIAAVGIANQVFLLYSILIMACCSGCGVFIAQYWGVKDEKNIRRVLGLCISVVTTISLVFTALILIAPSAIISIFNKDPQVIKLGSEYIRLVSLSYTFTAITFAVAAASRSVEKTVPPMAASFLALICNSVLNYIFIFGKAGFTPMGVKGAALGTLIARGVESFVLIIYLYKTNKVLWGKLSDLFSFNMKFSKKIFGVVIDVVLNELCWGLGSVVYSIVYGHMGTSAIAAIQIYNTVQNLFLVFVFGMAAASVVMIGKETGAGNKEKAMRYGYQSTALTAIIGIVASILLALSAGFIVSLFNIPDIVRYYAKMILYVVAFVFAIRSINIILIVGVLRGGGDAKYSLKIEAFTMWGIGVPLSFIGAFVLKWPVYWVVGLLTVEEIVKCYFSVSRLRTGKWIKRVTDTV
ncbi:putative efflux protein, MATE family [Gottschalkia purinilytica]|uniref:Probable multidrug resistance protein NorM n=2 Tax=Gottschalkia purinilytica TaxID=1503 RepID=A0A0L0W8I4_GOTPU|nr:putative efflux protein, MATE family [Gottschalkia purinilytica]